MTALVVTIYHPKTRPKLHLTVSVITILDTSELSSNMLISTWLASTVLNSGTHVKIKCYGITHKKVHNCKKKVFGSDVP